MTRKRTKKLLNKEAGGIETAAGGQGKPGLPGFLGSITLNGAKRVPAGRGGGVGVFLVRFNFGNLNDRQLLASSYLQLLKNK